MKTGTFAAIFSIFTVLVPVALAGGQNNDEVSSAPALAKVCQALEAQPDLGMYRLDSSDCDLDNPWFEFKVSHGIVEPTFDSGFLKNYFKNPVFGRRQNVKVQTTHTGTSTKYVFNISETVFPTVFASLSETPVALRLTVELDDLTGSLIASSLNGWYAPAVFGQPVWFWKNVYTLSAE